MKRKNMFALWGFVWLGVTALYILAVHYFSENNLGFALVVAPFPLYLAYQCFKKFGELEYREDLRNERRRKNELSRNN